MSQLFFLESPGSSSSMYPFTLTRDQMDIPLGLFSLREKWQLLLSPSKRRKQQRFFTLLSGAIPDPVLVSQLLKLKDGQSIFSVDGTWVATAGRLDQMIRKPFSTDIVLSTSIEQIRYPWELLTHLTLGIQLDFSFLTSGKRSRRLSAEVLKSGRYPVFIEKEARLYSCTLNTEYGPIYIGANAEVQEGTHIRGPFLLGSESVVKMGAKIYGPVAIGEKCIVGGEIKRSLVFPFSNKAHDGYMGDSVIGSWCNWGAGTSNSNLKNTAGDIQIEVNGKKISVGQKAGVFMGDHSKTAINSSINSGTVVGVSVQIGNQGLTPKWIPSFRWMNGTRYRLNEALEHIRAWKVLKGQLLSDAEITLLKQIYKNDK
jgi:UDP-N-acetylglucosamine diphosphorylase/glucosamine-1-phosphate N-acetyltransferase